MLQSRVLLSSVILALASAATGLVATAARVPEVVVADPASEGNSWPQWRGPERTGVSSESGWKTEGTELWKKDVGLGYSTVSIADGRLYTHGFVPASDGAEEGEDVIWCLNAEDGKEVWAHRYPAKRWAKYHAGGTNITPSIDGDRLFTANREGQFFCLDAKTGKVNWEKDAKKEAGTELPTWGFAAAPLVLEEAVLLNVGKVIAYDKKSGKVLWKSDDLGHAYSTPVDLQWNQKPCLAVFNGGGLSILSQKDGKTLLNYEWKTRHDVNAASPVVIGENGEKVFISSGYNHGCAMVKLGAEAIEPVWESKIMRNHMSGSVLWENHLYGFDENTLKCLDLDGNAVWEQKGLGKGALLVAGGKLVIISEKGELVIADATPKGFEELSREKVLDGSVCWTTPVLLNGLVYVRNQGGSLVCRDHRAQGSK